MRSTALTGHLSPSRGLPFRAPDVRAVAPHVIIAPQRQHSSRRRSAVLASTADGADISLAHGRARRRGLAELVLDGTRTDLECAPDAELDDAYARALCDRRPSFAAQPYTRLRTLRLRIRSSPAAEHLLRSSLLPALECLKLYNQCDDDGTQLPRVAPPEPDVEESGASVAVGRTPSDFFVFPGLRELTIDEGGTRHGSGRPWGEWYAFRHLSSLESLTWIGDYKCGLRGDARDALPALSGLRHLSLHSACRCPQGLAELQRMESLSATIGTGCGDSLGEWDLRGLRALRQAVFQGRGFGGLTHLPRMDASLTALERFCLVDARVPLQVAEAARDGPAGAGGGAPPSQQPKQQAQAAADTTAAAAEGQLDPLRDVFQAWVAPCHVLPSIAVVEVWYPLFMSAEGDFTGQLAINPRAGSWFGGGDGARWRARVWSYKGKGEYGEVTEPRMLRVVAGIPVEGMEGGAAQRLWLKLAFERV